MSYYVYPVINTDNACDDYTVRVNGKEVELNTARASAVPFNRRWPGHQRQIEQSEIIQFLSIETDEPLIFEIFPKVPFDSVRLRPKSLGITPDVENGRIKFTIDKPAYFTVEPYGRNHALHVFVDPVSEYRVDKSSPDVIYFGAGEHDAGTVELKSNQTLFIDAGAVVYACVHAEDAENIKILGRGILDNSKNRERILYDASIENNHEALNNAERVHTVQLDYCTDIEIDGITIRDSLVYNIRPVGCKNLDIRNVKIIGCWRFNSDGIDMHNCVNVHISNCFIRTFDDSICVKGFDLYDREDIAAALEAALYRNGRSYDVFKNALVEKCVIWNDWGKCLEIGAETKAEEICNITFRDCDLIHLTGTALDCMNVDYADVHSVAFKNISIECDEEIPAPLIQKSDAEVYENPDPDYMPFTVAVSVEFHHEYSKGSETRRGRNRDFVFENIRVFGSKAPKMKFFGYDEEHKTERVRVSSLFLNGEPLSSLPNGNWQVGNFTEDITLEYDPYAQIGKNTVDSKNQLKETELVKFDLGRGNGTKIMLVGNSITLHGVRKEIGWYNPWGMAASARENDYAHILMRDARQIDPDASFCICQVSDWELKYKQGTEMLYLYEQARGFGADVIVVRCIENCPKDSFNARLFKNELASLLNYLDGERKADIVITTGFWHHPGDDALREYAKENCFPCVELGDLGEDDTMKAVGLFEHGGVANHPGDLGMRAIAQRIAQPLAEIIGKRR